MATARKYTADALTGRDMRAIRQGLLLTQQDLAVLLGYAHKIRISEYERTRNPVPIPAHIREAIVRLWATGGRGKSVKSVRDWNYRDVA